MHCRLFDTKPLPETMMMYCQLEPRRENTAKFELRYTDFHTVKYVWNVVCNIATISFRSQCMTCDVKAGWYHGDMLRYEPTDQLQQ